MEDLTKVNKQPKENRRKEGQQEERKREKERERIRGGEWKG